VHVLLLLSAESVSWLVGGLVAGGAAALVAIVPAIAERGGQVPVSTGAAVLLLTVLATGVVSTLVAAGAATRTPLLEALRGE
jgi:hypothetical protein